MESRRHQAYGGIGQVCPWSDALMSREIIIYDVTTAKVLHVDVEHALFQHLDEDSGFVSKPKHGSSSTVPQCKFGNSRRTGTRVRSPAFNGQPNSLSTSPLESSAQPRAGDLAAEPVGSDTIILADPEILHTICHNVGRVSYERSEVPKKRKRPNSR